MPSLRAIKLFDTPGEATHVISLNLDHYDLMSFQGLWSKQQCDRLARAAITKSKAGFRFQRVITYHFFYQEWTAVDGSAIREAELEVGVV